jgi:DNA polymerase-3 subunit epsilon
MRFAAIDFETADRGADSACAVGLVRMNGGEVEAAQAWLIRPLRCSIAFTWLHGIAWEHVADEPDFAGVWPMMAPLLEGVDVVVAHNASFDRRVLLACMQAHGIVPPLLAFACTVRLARLAWSLRPTRLPDVCRHLGIELQRHHDPLHDALACAPIAAAALADGHLLAAALLRS